MTHVGLERQCILREAQWDGLRAQLSHAFAAHERTEQVSRLYFDTRDGFLFRSICRPESTAQLFSIRMEGETAAAEAAPVTIELSRKVGQLWTYSAATLSFRDTDVFLRSGVYREDLPAPQRRALEAVSRLRAELPIRPMVLLSARETELSLAEMPGVSLHMQRDIVRRNGAFPFPCGGQGELLLRKGDGLFCIRAAHAVPLPLARLLSALSIRCVSVPGAIYAQRAYSLRREA